jgi:hypothetical protein
MLFRDVNERINTLANGWRSGQPQELVCECSDETCTVSISVSSAEYEAIRAHAGRFLVAPGHEDELTERLVETAAGFSVVQKLPHELAFASEA